MSSLTTDTKRSLKMETECGLESRARRIVDWRVYRGRRVKFEIRKRGWPWRAIFDAQIKNDNSNLTNRREYCQ
jgi:hypothetical protein